MSNAVAIPDKYKDLLSGKKAFASLATLMPDGAPQVTPVWCDFDGEHVIFNSAKGRQKDRNVRRDPRVALAITRGYSCGAMLPGNGSDGSYREETGEGCKTEKPEVGNPKLESMTNARMTKEVPFGHSGIGICFGVRDSGFGFRAYFFRSLSPIRVNPLRINSCAAKVGSST